MEEYAGTFSSRPSLSMILAGVRGGFPLSRKRCRKGLIFFGQYCTGGRKKAHFLDSLNLLVFLHFKPAKHNYTAA